MPQRATKTSFKPGNLGGGRPKQDPDIIAALRAACPANAKRLIEMAQGKRTVIIAGKEKTEQIDAALQLKAILAINDRVYGTPRQSVDVTTEGVHYVALLPPITTDAEVWAAKAAQLNGHANDQSED